MRRGLGYILVFAMAVNVISLVISHAHSQFVRPSMGRWILVGGIVLAVASVVSVLWEPGAHEAPSDRGRAPIVAALLVVPLAALIIARPGSLGSYAAFRASSVANISTRTSFTPLKVGSDGIAEVTLLESWERARSDKSQSLRKQPLRLVGFVVPDAASTVQNPSFLLSRFKIACCAADALILQVRVMTTQAPELARDQWVTVVGSYTGTQKVLPLKFDAPVLRATAIERIGPPKDPYE